jgi:hypothetical protein
MSQLQKFLVLFESVLLDKAAGYCSGCVGVSGLLILDGTSLRRYSIIDLEADIGRSKIIDLRS